jgi:SAM-dependent methyltransferase
MKTHRPCPVCSSTSIHLLHNQRFALPSGHPLPTAFDIVACQICDCVFANTPAPATAYDNYYADYSKYADQGTSTGGGGSPLDQSRIDETAKTIARYLPDPSARIVDIGCANGGMLAALRSHGYTRILGVDPSPECVANTTRLFGIPALQGWLGALPAEVTNADLIILSHVLEHVLDLGPAVEKLRAVLAPGGMVYVEVPDAAHYVECLAAPFQDFNTEHINHFGQESLGNLFVRYGFELVAEGSKYLPLAGGLTYPACFAIFRYTAGAAPHAFNWRRAPNLLSAIDRYIENSSALLVQIDARLSSVLHGPIIVWGVGQLTLKLLVETELGSADIVAFIDGNPLHHGKELHGRAILSPERLRTLPAYPIVVGSLLHHDAIVQRIRSELALPNLIITLN